MKWLVVKSMPKLALISPLRMSYAAPAGTEAQKATRSSVPIINSFFIICDDLLFFTS